MWRLPDGSFQRGMALLLLLLTAWVCVAMISYDARDSDHYYPATAVRNWCGLPGVALAQPLYLWLGVVAWMLPLSIALCAWIIGRGGVSPWQWLQGLLVWSGVVLWCCLCATRFDPDVLLSVVMPSRGGMIGLFLESWLQRRAGHLAMRASLALLPLAVGAYAVTMYCEYRLRTQYRKQQESMRAGTYKNKLGGNRHASGSE